MKVAVYTRVSTKKDEQAESRQVQEAVYTEYCNEKGYELYKVYGDSETGTNVRGRKEFIEMLYDAGLDYVRSTGEEYDSFTKSNREPKFNMIIVKDVTRWSRSQHLGMMIVEYLRDKGVYVLFESAGVYTKDDYYLSLSILFTVAENESQAMSKKIKFTKQYKAKKGHWSPARLPYGFIRNENNEIVIDEKQARIVKLIFELYKENGSTKIAKLLNEKGYVSQQGAKWSSDKVLRIVKNTIYYGTATTGKTTREKVTDTYKKKIPKEEWYYIENAVEPIITYELWKQINDKIKRSVNPSKRVGRRPAVNDIYYEKIYCQECGSRFVRHFGDNDKINYMCQNRRKGHGCKVRGISINNINNMMDKIHANDFANNTANNVGYKRLINKISEEKKLITERRDAITHEIKMLEQENETTLQGLKKQLAGGSQTIIDMLTQDIEDNKERITELESNLNKLNMSAISELEDMVEKKRLLIEEIRFNDNVTNEEKMKLLDNIVVGDYECIFSFNFPNFEDEIVEFNSIFTANPIHSSIGQKFVEHFRRNHKEAREYWAEQDEYGIREYDAGLIMTGKNVTQEAKDIEDMLEQASKL